MDQSLLADDPDPLLQRALAADESALAALFDQFRPQLKRMVKLRLDRRLQGRVDASDVLQDAYLDLAQRLPEYAKHPKLSFYIWLRFVTGQRLAQTHRKHLGAKIRNAGIEISIDRHPLPQASSEFLAGCLAACMTSVSDKLAKAEAQAKLQEVLNAMDEDDREVLALRHFEELNNEETAQALGIHAAAASKRYIRALRRLKQQLSKVTGNLFE